MKISRFYVGLAIIFFSVAYGDGDLTEGFSPKRKLIKIPDRKIPQLIEQFISKEWPKVFDAQFALEAKQERVIPQLISLLDQDEKVKLKHTGDLIYPGADTYWGHGGIVRYDIDWISVRAGWTLEQITFEDFGFSEGSISEEELIRATMAGRVDVPLGEVVPIDRSASLRKSQREIAIKKAKEWWKHQADGWKRLPALFAALESDNSFRVLEALHWLRFEETPIDGFNKEQYVEKIYPIIEQLAGSPDEEIAIQANYLVRDYQENQWLWYEWKLDVWKGRR